MTDRLDPHLAAIERRLERASLPTATPGLRRRVLAAVSDVLHEKVPATTSGWSGGASLLSSPDLVAGTFFLAAAAVALWLVVVSVLRPVAPLTLEDRGRIAGVSAEMLRSTVVDGHVAESLPRSTQADDIHAHPSTLRVFDGHRLLEEIL